MFAAVSNTLCTSNNQEAWPDSSVDTLSDAAEPGPNKGTFGTVMCLLP